MFQVLYQYMIESNQLSAQALAKLESDNLKKTPEWELINRKDPKFANRLVIAWEGDAREYVKNPKFESLFLKMVDHKAIEKLSTLKVDEKLHGMIKHLIDLYTKSMPMGIKPKFVDNSIWKDVRLVKEYVSLQKEVDILLS